MERRRGCYYRDVSHAQLVDPDNPGNRWHVIGVEDEEHVMARRSPVGCARCLHGESRRIRGKAQPLKPLVLVERMRYGTQSDEADFADTRCLGRSDAELIIIPDLG